MPPISFFDSIPTGLYSNFLQNNIVLPTIRFHSEYCVLFLLFKLKISLHCETVGEGNRSKDKEGGEDR